MIRLRLLIAPPLFLCAVVGVSQAQLAPKPDPLARQSSTTPAVCSATESSCAAAAAKILPLIMGPSTLEENLRRLTDDIGGRVTGSPEMAKAVDWAVAAFRAAGSRRPHRKIQVPRHLGRRRYSPRTPRPRKISRSPRRRGLVALHAPGGIEAISSTSNGLRRFRARRPRQRRNPARPLAKSDPPGPICSTNTPFAAADHRARRQRRRRRDSCGWAHANGC